MIKQIRQEEGVNILLFDTGNCLSGQPLVDISKGAAMTKALSAMHYDAMALGSADFGIGYEAVEALINQTDFPILSANIVRGQDDSPELFTRAYAILEVPNGEAMEKIAVLGVSNTAEFGKVAMDLVGDLRAIDPVESLGPILEEVKRTTDRIIVLSNLSREQEVVLAETYPDIDIIIGSRTPLFQNQPVYVKGGEVTDLESEGENLSGGTLIASGMDKGRGLGILDVAMDGKGNIEQFEFNLVGIQPDQLQEDPDMAALLHSYENELREKDAALAMKEYEELTGRDNSHLKNLAWILETGAEARQAYEAGDFKKAFDLLSMAKDSLTIRERADEKRDEYEAELAKGTPEDMKTDRLKSIADQAQRYYADKRYIEARKKWSGAIWTLSKMRRIKEKYAQYLRDKDILQDRNIDLSMSEKQKELFEKAIREERFSDALDILQRVNMKITQAKNVMKWNQVANELIENIGEDVLGDSFIARTKQMADSTFLASIFHQSRFLYNKLTKLLEPMAEEKGLFKSSDEEDSGTREGDRYVGSEACRECHPRQYDQWNLTLHSRAVKRMDEKARDDPSCMVCHVVGLGEEDGYKIGEDNPGLGAVGCEVCHGRGFLHAESGGKDPMKPGYARDKCTECHDVKQGFDFDYFPLLVRVMHK